MEVFCDAAGSICQESCSRFSIPSWILYAKLFEPWSWHLPNELSSSKRDFQRHSENTVLVKELFPAFRKPLATTNSFHCKCIPSRFWFNCQALLPLILFRLLVPLDTKFFFSKMKLYVSQSPLLITWGFKNTSTILTVINNKWYPDFNFYHWFLCFLGHIQTIKLILSLFPVYSSVSVLCPENSNREIKPPVAFALKYTVQPYIQY